MVLFRLGAWTIEETKYGSMPFHSCPDSQGKASSCACSACQTAYISIGFNTTCMWCEASVPDEILALLILHNGGI